MIQEGHLSEPVYIQFVYLEKNRLAKSNAEQVEKIVRIGREFGIEFATPDEARQILGLKGQDEVGF